MTRYFICGIVSSCGGAVGGGDTRLPPHAASASTRASPKRRTPLQRAAGLRGSVLGLSRPAPADIAGRVHLLAQREDLVVDPRGRQHHSLSLVPGERASGQLVFLPDHDPDPVV